MGKAKKGMVRFRLFFDDHVLLNNSQLSAGHGRCWLLLKPSIATFSDLASHLCKKFALRDRLVLCIGDFVLPPFESTRIIKDEDIIRVKMKNVKLKDVSKPSYIQDLAHDSQMAKAQSLTFNSHINAGEKSLENSQGNLKNENAAHEGSLSFGILVPRQKRENTLKLHNPVKRQKYNCTEKQVTSVGVQDLHSRQSRTVSDLSGGSKMELHVETNTFDRSLVVAESGTEVKLREHGPDSSMPCKGRKQLEGINNSIESQLPTVCGVTKEYAQLSCATNKMEQNQFTKKIFEEKNDYDWLGEKPEEDSSKKIVHSNVQKIYFSSLFPLTRSPLKDDILAYRYVEPSSTVFPELSSPQVGRVSAFDNKSSVVILVKALEFEVFSEENSNSLMLSGRVSPYKQDGSLEIKLSSLIDVRLLKAHDSKELACLPEETLNRIKNSWEVPSAKSNWNQFESHYIGREAGAKSSANERPASSSWIYGASPAAALFWETVLSKGAFGKAGKCSGSGKF